MHVLWYVDRTSSLRGGVGLGAASGGRWFGVCTADDVPVVRRFRERWFPSAGFRSAAEALRAGVAFADYLNASRRR